MKYEISKAAAPAMPNLGKGTEIVKLLLSQASKDMYEPLVPMFFPIFGAHIFGAEFQYPDFSWKEPTGMMANLVAKSGDNKGQLTTLAKAICRDFSQHDEAEEKKILEWQKQKQTEPDNKKKTARPDVFFRFPPSNTTNAAFIQNALALEAHGGLTQYFNLPEVEMADRLCGGHKQVSVLRQASFSTFTAMIFLPGRQSMMTKVHGVDVRLFLSTEPIGSLREATSSQ